MSARKPKEIEPDLVSDSTYNDIPLEQAINDAVKDLQEGLNNLQMALLSLITHDEIAHDEYAEIYYLSREYVDISKELVNIVKSFKPAGWRAPKLSPDTIAQQQINAE